MGKAGMITLPQFERLGGNRGIAYMTRVVWGRYRFHVFHRGDVDPDPHDHMWRFQTFPLVSYIEEVWPIVGRELPRYHVVKAFRWHWRPAHWRHRVIGRADGKLAPIISIVITGPKERVWGFWPDGVFVEWWRYFGMKRPPAERPSARKPLRRPG